MSTANTEGMSEPVPTFTRARLRFYSAACGVMIACIVYAQAVAMGALR
jgi:hypothetical protein